MRNEPAERGTIGEEDREVIQSEPPAMWHRRRTRQLMERNERCVVIVCSKRRTGVASMENPEAEHISVVSQRPMQVRNLKLDPAEPSRIGDAIAGRRDTVARHFVVSRSSARLVADFRVEREGTWTSQRERDGCREERERKLSALGEKESCFGVHK
jgi:hypothetical protein